MQGHPSARRGNHLGDPTAHLSSTDYKNVLELHAVETNAGEKGRRLEQGEGRSRRRRN
jgi:hypothetical protein